MHYIMVLNVHMIGDIDINHYISIT